MISTKTFFETFLDTGLLECNNNGQKLLLLWLPNITKIDVIYKEGDTNSCTLVYFNELHKDSDAINIGFTGIEWQILDYIAESYMK